MFEQRLLKQTHAYRLRHDVQLITAVAHAETTFLQFVDFNNIALLEPSLQSAKEGVNYQFERKGYFIIDSRDSSDGNLVFNRTVTLRDSWAKKNK